MVGEITSCWSIRDRQLDLSCRPLVMGVLNVTPDSFSDGGLYLTPETATEHALTMVEQGADLIDVGGESSRPGAQEVSLDEEIDRILPVIQRIATSSDIPISIDTTKAEVARLAIQAGAHIINDISGLRLDPRIAEVAAHSGAGLILMHMQGTPRTMQIAPHYSNLLGEIAEFLDAAANQALAKGVPAQSIALDPGIGFGKTIQHNWEILAGLRRVCRLGYPVVIGTSRKSFLQACVGKDPRDLEAATLATCVVAGIQGARIVRVHDVRSHRRAMEVLQQLLGRLYQEDAAGS